MHSRTRGVSTQPVTRAVRAEPFRGGPPHDADSGVAAGRASPRYRRVKRHVLERIGSGAWAPGDRLPSERELVETLQISRMTVNRALRELTEEGFLIRHPGAGTFVADRRAHGDPVRVRNIADEIRSRGHRYGAVVMTARNRRARRDEAGLFVLARGARLYHTRIVHTADGVPIQLEDRLVNPAIAPGYLDADFTAITPNEYLMRVAPLASVEQTVQAIRADAATAEWLEMPEEEACLLIRRRTWTGRRVASHAMLYHPGSRYDLSSHFNP